MRKFDLKPCPFCGDPNPQVVWDSGDEDKLGVKCFKCGGCIDTEKDTVEEAVEAWNNRVIDLVDLEGYSDKLWRAACERGKAEVLDELMEYTYGMLASEKFGLQHKIKSMMDGERRSDESD